MGVCVSVCEFAALLQIIRTKKLTTRKCLISRTLKGATVAAPPPLSLSLFLSLSLHLCGATTLAINKLYSSLLSIIVFQHRQTASVRRRVACNFVVCRFVVFKFSTVCLSSQFSSPTTSWQLFPAMWQLAGQNERLTLVAAIIHLDSSSPQLYSNMVLSPFDLLMMSKLHAPR